MKKKAEINETVISIIAIIVLILIGIAIIATKAYNFKEALGT